MTFLVVWGRTLIQITQWLIWEDINNFFFEQRNNLHYNLTNISCLHIGSRTGLEGSKTVNSYRAIEPAQPATKAVCIIWTESKQPRSFKPHKNTYLLR
jgi:hypothetical protein